MGTSPLTLLVLIGAGMSISGVSALADSQKSSSFESAIEILMHTPTGKMILSRAQVRFNLARAQDVIQILRWSKVSKTDAVLTRRYNPLTGEEVRERQVTVHLKQGLTLRDLALDLAHELTHASAQPNWDPYDPELTAERYVRAAIEGDGGEVDAFVNECQVALELEARFGVSAARCTVFRADHSAVTLTSGMQLEVNREQIKKHFYRVGSNLNAISERFGDEIGARFPLLSGEEPSLYSSTGQAPYPMALIREYDEITEAACSNSRKRLGSESLGSSASMKAAAVRLIESRCSTRTPASVRR